MTSVTGVPERIDGISFLPVLKGEDHEIHPYVYGVWSHQNILKTRVFPSRMVRSKKFKYIRNFNSLEVAENNYGDNPYVNAFIKLGAEAFPDTPHEELYDIVHDPFEQNNLATDPAYRETRELLVKEMYRWMHAQGDFLVKENYMPILKPVHNRLDQTTVHKTVPEELENTLTEKDYLILHY